MELKLKNQKTTFDVEAVDGELSLSGARCSVDIENGDIAEFNAGITRLGQHAGHAYYNEKRGRIHCNVSDVVGYDYTTIHNFVHACIDEIKVQLNLTPANTNETTNEE
jgi:hypothetical protein